MKKLRGVIERHKTLFWALTFGALLFFNCCGFPVYNLTTGRGLLIGGFAIYNTLVPAWLCGKLLFGLTGEGGALRAALCAVLGIGGGLCLRYLLEFGEVSNTVNFTPANIAVHGTVFLGLVMAQWPYELTLNKREREEQRPSL